MRNIILHIVGLRNGIKAVDLALDVMSRVNPQRFDTEIYHRAIDDLVECGEIKSFEYEDPEYPNKVMFMYFSKGTNFLNLRSFDERIHSKEIDMVRESVRNLQISYITEKRDCRMESI